MDEEDASRSAACERCHRRKARCDKARPACASCVKADVSCVYSSRDPGLRRREVERLERRLRQVEAKNEALTSQLLGAQRRVTPHGTLSPSQGEDARAGEGTREGSRSRSININHSNSNEVAGQVSCLSLNVGGEQQFLGSASGLLLGNLLQVDARPIIPSGRDDDFYTTSRRFGSGSGLGNGAVTSKAADLPSERLARSLVSAYLSHDHLCYPFIHPQPLMEAIDAIYADDTFYASHLVEAFTIDMILAIGTAQVYKFDWQVLPDAETHYDRAMSRFPRVLDRGGIIALQAILLLCQYRMLSATYDTSASLWHLIGAAARICFELGLHRESVYSIPEGVPSRAIEDSRKSSEIKRRCFWCVFSLDRIASITLGRPLAINLDDVDTELPHVGPNPMASPGGPLSTLEAYDSPQWISRTAIFVHIVRYRVICGKILTSLHNTIRPKTHAGYTTIRQELAQELDSWHRDTDSLALVDVKSATDQTSFRSRDWYNLLYHNGVLMLYRPSPTLHDLPQNSEILQRIFDAAQQSIAVYGYLHRSRKINYSWITLHAVFIAGLSYVYAVRVHFQTRRRQIKASTNHSQIEQGGYLVADPTINQIVNATRACLTVLVAVSERWSTARNCHTVFGRLSDASIADVVEFYTQPVPEYSTNSGNVMLNNGNSLSNSSFTGLPSVQAQPYLFAAPADVANSYQDCFNELPQLWDVDYGNETLLQASQEWLLEIQALNAVF